MGSEKRERQKAQRAARVEADREAAKRELKRRRMITFVVLAVVLAGVLGLYALLTGDNEPEIADDETAAVEPCVALEDELPDGAPQITVPEGEPPGELVVEDLVEGDGAQAASGDDVVVHYVGVACSTGEIFDESYSSGEPVPLSLDAVVEGWGEGIPGMQVGGQRLLTIPPELAYGDEGRPGIPPGDTLVFAVELVDVNADN